MADTAEHRSEFARGQVTPEDFRAIFRKGAERLDQPGEQTPGFDEFLTSGTQELAESFVERFFERTGKLPDEALVSKFVGENLNSAFASRIIEGTQPRGKTKSSIVDPFLDIQGIGTAPGTGATEPSSVQDRLSTLIGNLRQQVPGQVRTAFAPARRRAVEEESIRGGRLRSPISRTPTSAIPGVEQGEGQTITDLLRGLTTQELSGTLDLFKFDESIKQAERRAAESRAQFGSTLGFERERFDVKQDQFKQELSLSKLLGRLQAQGRKPGTLDFLNTAFRGLGAVAQVGAATRGGGQPN